MGDDHDQVIACRRFCRRAGAGSSSPPRRRTMPTRDSARFISRPRATSGATAVRSRHAVSAFVLVSASTDIFEDAQGRSGMRHGLLGRGACCSIRSCRRRQPSARPCRHPEGQGHRCEDAARARLYRRARAIYVDYDKIDHRTRVQSYLKAMEALAGRYPMTMRRRSPTPSRSTSRPRPPTRPMPTSSRARRSWRRSPSASPSIPASPTI